MKKTSPNLHPSSPKIVFIGTPEFGAIILEKLCEANFKPYSGRWPNEPFRPVLVVTAPDKPVGRKKIITPPPVKIVAQKYNIPVSQPEILVNSKSQITNSKPDLIIVAAYGQILPKEILEIPKYGCLNVHPSLLPKYRGASPIQYAILNEDKETGVTIILMDKKMDHGKIISNSKFLISNVEPLPGYREPKPMVFASIYPENPDDFDVLKEAMSKLKLNDASLSFESEMRVTLGRGFRCGFLGTLHAEIVSERLRREFGLDLVISNPSVVYKIINQKEKETFVYSPSDWPPSAEIKEAQEPWVKIEIMTPTSYLGEVSDLLKSSEGNLIETKYFTSDKLLLIYEIPLREIIIGFYDKLKGQTQGFASMNCEVLGYRPADFVKLEILIAGKQEEAFSKIVPKASAFKEGKRIVEKLKEILPSQLFSVSLQARLSFSSKNFGGQAAVSGKIIARETMKANRRDVIAPLYGGDYTRKRKLLEKQKKGKKELKEKGRIRIPPRVFLEMLRS